MTVAAVPASTPAPGATPGKAARLFSPAAGIALVLVGAFAFIGFLALQAYAPDLRGGDNGGEHALSKSAVGYAGLVELLKGAGRPVLVSRGPIHASRSAAGVLVLTPGPGTDAKALTKVRFDGPALIVLPKWEVMPSPLLHGWVDQAGTAPASMVADILPRSVLSHRARITQDKGAGRPVLSSRAGSAFVPDQTFTVGQIEQLQTISSNELIPVLVDAQGRTVLGRVKTDDDEAQSASSASDASPAGAPSDAASSSTDPAKDDQGASSSGNASQDDQNQDAPASKDQGAAAQPATANKPPVPMQIKGAIYVLADPDLLDNHGLKSLDTARAAVSILDNVRGSDGPVVMDVTLHGLSRGRSILKLAFEPPFLGLTLALLGAAALMGWHAYARFGPNPPRQRAIAFGKTALVDNSSALIRVAHREPRMAPGYVNLVRALVAHLTGAPRDLDRADLDALLDRIGQAKGAQDKISTLAEEAEGLKDKRSLMRVAAKLHRWRTEMTRERQ